jgi:PqqD family protein of HPr-rel-A system
MSNPFQTEVTLTKGGFLFDHSTGLTYTLNPTGSVILECLQQGNDAPGILEKLIVDFEVDAATAERDLEDFIRQMKELGLVSQ